MNKVLLVAPGGQGGEGVYTRTLLENPPEGTTLVWAGGSHQAPPGSRCHPWAEVLLNRIVRKWAILDAGFRILEVRGDYQLIHVHAHPARLSLPRPLPIVMSEGSSSAVYLREYLNWSEAKMASRYARARRLYKTLRIHDRLVNLEGVAVCYVFSRWARDVNLRWGADPAKMEVVPPGFPTPPEVARDGRGTFTFLFVGTDFERKGGFEVLDAFERLVRRHPEARLILVTPDPQVPHPDRAIHAWVDPGRREALLKVFHDLIRRGLVEHHPLIDRRQLYEELYPRADAFVMPSRAEGFGFTNVEAMSFGLPVVSSSIGAIPEVIQDGITGFLVPPADVTALTERMERLASDPLRARTLGGKGREVFLARYTLERFRAELARVYRIALGR